MRFYWPTVNNSTLEANMNGYVRYEYNRLRRKGWTAFEAYRNARIRDKFTDLENEGRVRLNVVMEQEVFDDSYLDTWGLCPARLNRKRTELRERIDRDGVWCLQAEAQCDKCGRWKVLDSISGFVGDDWKDSGYDSELMQVAIESQSRVAVD